MPINNKVKSYFGFAIKSGNIIYGGDNVIVSRKRMYVVVCSKELNRTALKQVEETCKSKQIKLLFLDTSVIEELTNRNNCKCVAVCEPNLAKAIYNELSGGFNE